MKPNNILSKALRKPSIRTQMESAMVGIIVMLLSSLAVYSYLLIYSEYTLFMKIFLSFGELGILLMMLSNLVTMYQQYYSHKLMMGMYEDKDTKETNIICELPITAFDSFKLNSNEEVKNGK